ncbi:MAG: hypothetical protein JO340_13070 [Acidobacteriaceae bacterium]|nr:hypothetical protein [Acidobacteriaceae bacterium]
MNDSARFCSACGANSAPATQYSVPIQQPYFAASPHHPASKGLGQVFGLDPRIAFLAFVVDFMLFSGGALSVAASVGLSLPVLFFISLIAGVALGSLTYKAQMSWYGDDRDSALIKGGIVGLLTAIPVGIPALVWLPSGILGWLHNRRKQLVSQS